MMRSFYKKIRRKISTERTRRRANRLFRECFDLVKDTAGDFVEFGVYNGRSFLDFVAEAKKRGQSLTLTIHFEAWLSPGTSIKTEMALTTTPKDNWMLEGVVLSGIY